MGSAYRVWDHDWFSVDRAYRIEFLWAGNMMSELEKLKRHPSKHNRKTSINLPADCSDWLRASAKRYAVTMSDILTAIIRDEIAREEALDE